MAHNNTMSDNPILALPEFGKVFHVDCDASGTSIGAALRKESKLIKFFNENAKKKCFSV
jgi:hypothetical protein